MFATGSVEQPASRCRRHNARPWFLALAVVLAGCPVTPRPTRDGGTPCTTMAECNPGGTRCGSVYLCVQNFCANTPTLLACVDSDYPDAPVVGNCLTYEDCNPLPRCGSVISCVAFRCDPDGPRIEVPCRDAGLSDADSDADASAVADAPDAAADSTADAGADAGDASVDAADVGFDARADALPE